MFQTFEASIEKTPALCLITRRGSSSGWGALDGTEDSWRKEIHSPGVANVRATSSIHLARSGASAMIGLLPGEGDKHKGTETEKK